METSYTSKYTGAEIDRRLGLVAEKSNLSKLVTSTLLAASWSSDALYSLPVSGVTETSINEILPAVDITTEQLEALQAANLMDNGQNINTIKLKAYGTVPTIDIPIRVIVRGDM